MNVSALMTNAGPAPSVPTMIAARMGPTSCPTMNWSVLRLTASWSSSRGTSAGNIAMSDGFASA